MLRTEEEASKAWCPFARTLRELKVDGATFAVVAANRNRSGELIERSCCLASACMAWRWGPEKPPTRYVFVNQNEHPPVIPGESGVVFSKQVPTPEERDADCDLDPRGYWVETIPSFEARLEAWREARRGFCRLAGAAP